VTVASVSVRPDGSLQLSCTVTATPAVVAADALAQPGPTGGGPLVIAIPTGLVPAATVAAALAVSAPVVALMSYWETVLSPLLVM
jgi:hypothetical protein